MIAADGVLCDISQRLAGPDLRVSCLVQPGEDPHQFRLNPRQSRELREARLVLINGYGLSPGLSERLKAGAAGAAGAVVAVAEQAVPDSPELDQAHSHEESHNQDQTSDHRHGSRDPHVWHDPRQAAAMVRLVAREFERLNPAAAPRFAARATAMAAVLAQLHRWNRRQLATIPATKPLATGHRAFASLARAYGLRELPLVDGMSSSNSLRPQAFQAAVGQLKRERVPVLFAEQLPPSKALQRISALSGIPLAPAPLVADGLAPTAGAAPNLVATLSANVCLISKGLKGQCDAQGQQALIRQWLAIR